jgi:hypothetical protein
VPAGALVKGLMVMFSIIIVVGTFALFLWGNISIEDIFGLALGWGHNSCYDKHILPREKSWI